MLDFSELEQNAKVFPKLVKANIKQSPCGCFFFVCFTPTQVLADAQLIQQIAESLVFYDENTNTKKLVLIGAYVYFWSEYNNSLQRIWSKPLLNLFQEQLEVDSLSSLDHRVYKESLDKLNDFSNWVFHNRKSRELKPLYDALPAEMQSKIYIKRNTSFESLSWASLLPEFIMQEGVKKLL